MLIDFFMHLKERKLPVSTGEYLALLEALQAGLANYSLDDFYTISRLCLVKKESDYDKFDVAFGEYFQKLQGAAREAANDPLDEFLHAAGAMQPGDNLFELEALQQGMPHAEIPKAKGRDDEEPDLESPSQGGGKNPFGEGGKHQAGVRVDKPNVGNRSAIKAWDSREFMGLDDEVELNTRSIKIALRRLRKFAREGVDEELDLEQTISSTARNAGWLDIRMRPERRNKVKVLILFDVGGSMAPHVKLCEELFSAAKAEFKQLEWFYFHNVVSDTIWRNTHRHIVSHYSLHDVMNKYGKDHKLIIVGDASMGVTELVDPGGGKMDSAAESGAIWMARLVDHYKQAVWLNPEPQRLWHLTQTIGMLRDIMGGRMYSLTLSGLEQAMKVLGK